MKIKELHLRNIASIEKADIDFEKDVIDRQTGELAGIFLISGDTGSGKSVILDGIAMALYKRTPRIEGVANKTKNTFENNQGESVSINSIEQYTRLGISEKDECYSEVVFEGNDGKEYHARLTLGMSRGNTDASGRRPIKYRTPLWEVKVGSEDWHKVDSGTGQPILGAVGLTFKQFGRMAMLAQGQFASFLTGGKAEREEILEQLTNTEKFSKYGQAISNLFSQAKTDKEKAEALLKSETEHTLGLEKVSELMQAQESLQQEMDIYESALDKSRTDLQLVKEVTNNLAAKQDCANQVAALQAAKESETYRTRKELVAGWDSTNQERKAMADKIQSEKEKDQAEQILALKRQEFEKLSSDLLFREIEVKKVQTETQELDAWVENRKGLDKTYTQASTIAMQLDRYRDTMNQLANTGRDLEELQNRAKPLAQAVGEAGKMVEAAKKAVATKQNEIDLLTQERNALNPTETNAVIARLTKQKGDLETVKERLSDIGRRSTALAEAKKTLENEAQALGVLKASRDKEKELYGQAESKWREAFSLHSTMKQSVEETLTGLRGQLRSSHAETCPLCGQHIDADHLQQDFHQMLTPLQKIEEAAQAALTEAKARFEEAKGAYDSRNGAVEAKRQQLIQDEKSIQGDESRVKEQLEKYGLQPDRSIAQQVLDWIGEMEVSIAQLQKKQQDAEDLLDKINTLAETKKPLDETLAKAQNQLSTAQSDESQNNISIGHFQSVMTELGNTKGTLEKALEASLTAAYPTWKDHVTDTKAALERDAKEYMAKKDLSQKNHAEIGKSHNLLSVAKSIRSSIVEVHGDWDKVLSPKSYTEMTIEEAWPQINAIVSAQDGAVAHAQETIGKADEVLLAYYQATGKDESMLRTLIAAEQQIREAREFVADIDSRHKSRCDAMAAATENIARLLQEFGVDTLDRMPRQEVIEERLRTLAEKVRVNAERMGAIVSQLKDEAANTQRKNQAEEALKKAEAVFSKWERLNKIFGGSNFRTLVQSYILRPLLNNANIYLEKITDRYVLTCSDDNEQLSILVLDRYNKNQVRSVTVLSGGERFMISLALSLALSSLNRQDMNVNILFIDEGFGTLDEANLSSVMATLEKLQEIAGQSERRVGIISHREELVERIPVKIRVKKKGEGRSMVEVINE